MKARTALLELFKDSSEWRAFYRSCCETSPFRLRSQAWQFCDELEVPGHRFLIEEVEDSLLGLARELLPNTRAAHWDAEWAHDLCKDAVALLAKRYAELSAQEKDTVDPQPKTSGMSGCMTPDGRMTRSPSGWRSKAGNGWDWKLWNDHELEEVLHEFFEWYG
jgi:hypothetical protein